MAGEEVDGGGLESGAIEEGGGDGANLQEAELSLTDGRDGGRGRRRGGGRRLGRENTHGLQAGEDPLAGVVEGDGELRGGLVGGAATESF